MRSRLISLLEAWASWELRRSSAKSMFIPADSYIWIKDKLGRWHHGSYDGFGHFVPLQASFTLISSTSKRETTRLEEFGAAFRGLEEMEQGLIVVAHFGEEEEWRGYLVAKGLANRPAERLLKQAWLHLVCECRKRDLL